MEYKYNEELYGETIYNKGFQTDYINSELTILVKYLKQIKGLKRKKTEEFLYEFCEKYIEGFNKVKYFKVIDRAIVKGRKRNNSLIVIKNIPIFKEELEYIDSLSINHEYKKLLLSFIINKKISFEFKKINGGNNDIYAYFAGNKKRYSNIFKMANIVGKYKIDDIIYELVNKKIISSVINGGIILDYMFNIYPTRTEIIKVKDKEIDKIVDEERKIIVHDVNKFELYEEITDFENIGYVFDYYKGVNNIKKCECCGKYIKTKSNSTRYCKDCAKENEKNNIRKRVRKHRKTNKCNEIEN